MIDFSQKKHITGAKHYFQEINQLYHPSSEFKLEAEEIIYSFGILNQTKFNAILLKEWFYLLRPEGFLVIDYVPNILCDQTKLEKLMWWLWKNNYEILYHDAITKKDFSNLSIKTLQNFIKNCQESKKLITNSNVTRFVCKKTSQIIDQNDSIDMWSFGIITKGMRPEWVSQIIESIKKQNIPKFEIIICGTFEATKDSKVNYIQFQERDDKGWIARKKNLIIKNSRYNNICILHDRLVLDNNWYRGIKKWGNCFEFITGPQLYGENRVNDWVVRHFEIRNNDKLVSSYGSYVDYQDWYKNVIIQGQYILLKKKIITNNNLWFDETMYYGEGEDFVLSEQMTDSGLIHRFNPNAKTYSLAYKEINPTFIKSDEISETPKTDYNSIYAFLKLGSYLLLQTIYFLHINISGQLVHDIREIIYDLLIRIDPSKHRFYREWRTTSQGRKNE